MRQTLKYARARKIRGYTMTWEYDHKQLRDFKEMRIDYLTKYSWARAGVHVKDEPRFCSGRREQRG